MAEATFLSWRGPAAAGVFVLLVAATIIVTRARGLRRHNQVIGEAVGRMCAERASDRAHAGRLHRHLVEMLLRQDEAAVALERGGRSKVPIAGGPPLDAERRGDLAEAVAATRAVLSTMDPVAAVTAALGPSRRGWSELDPYGAGDDTSQPIRPVPRPGDGPGFADLYPAIAASVRTQVRVARAVLRAAEGLGEPTTECRAELEAALDRATDAQREAARLADAGEPLLAMLSLTNADVPLPEEGLPGYAARRELRSLAYALADAALLHRDELDRWCADAIGRWGPTRVLTGEVGG